MILLSLFVVSFNNLRAFITQKVVWRGVDFGVNVVGKILKKGGEKTIQCDTCDSKKTTLLLEGARILACACVRATVRAPSREDVFTILHHCR